MKLTKRLTAICLSALLAVGAAAPALAKEAEPSEKEEVIYATLNGDGSLRNTYVVNSFSGGNIPDYGSYTSVKILNTNDPIQQNGDTITFSTSAQKAYYQGELADAELPWNISLRYYLDGNEYSAEEIAGKSGKLEIRFQIADNTACSGTFFQDYALQATFTLDTERCSNISAPDATIASVGSDKQLTYTVLPGKDAVEQLDNGAVELSGGSSELLGGSSALKDGASSLQSGITSLDEGVVTLQNGLAVVQNGLESLNTQSDTLTTGSSKFKAALATIQTAVNSISVTNTDLTMLTEASAQIKQAINSLYDGAATLQANLGYAQYKALMAQNGLDIDGLLAGNTQAVETIRQYEALLEQVSSIPGLEGVVEQYKSEVLGTAEQVIQLLNANNAAISGMESYLDEVSSQLPAFTEGLGELKAQYETFDASIIQLVKLLGNMTGPLSSLAGGINQLAASYEELDCGLGAYTQGVAQIVAGYSQVMSGVSSLAQGSKELVSGSEDLYDGTVELYDGVVSLCDGAQEMANGTGEFRAETTEMDHQIDEKIDSLLDSIGGSMDNPVSFVSEKNIHVDSVQFVIQTEAIEIEQPGSSQTPEKEETSLGEKLLGLFQEG